MHVAELDEVQYDLELDGELAREQLSRRVWETKGWATVAIAFRERDKAGAWRASRLALLRFRRVHDTWQRQAQLTLSGDEARALSDELATWFRTPAPDDE
ncbi:hypothetical protein BH11MYX1_BH11MYX1_24490 [soil metagenome]